MAPRLEVRVIKRITRHGFSTGCRRQRRPARRVRPAGSILVAVRAAFAAAWLLAAGCGAADHARDNTLTILYPGDERILSPYWEMPAKFLVFLPLATYDEHGELVGALARAWEHSADYREWTFHLRTDVRWHDGEPFTAHDIEFTYRMWQDPNVLWVVPDDGMVTVHDDSTATIRYRLPQRAPDTWSAFYPRHLLEDLDRAEWLEWPYWLRPVGNGPFRYLRHVPQTMVELEANPDYYRGRPTIDRIVLRFGTRHLTELLSGGVDAMHYVEHGVVPRLRADPRFEVYHSIWPDASWADVIYWNHRDPILADARVRRAFTHAIDRAELRAFFELPDYVPIVDVLYSDRQFRRRDLPPALEYDPREAGRLLDEAGWRDSDGDGIRERNGVPLRFTAILGAGTMDEQGDAAAVYVQDALRRVGARMELERVETVNARLRIRRGEYQAAFGRFFVPAVFYDDRRNRWWRADGSSGYANPRAIELLDSLLHVARPEHVDSVFRALAPILQEDVPVTLLLPSVQTIVAHRRVRGLRSPFRSDPVMHAEHLWLDGRPAAAGALP